MGKRDWRLWAAIALAALGVSRTVGKYLELSTFQLFTRSLAISPNPAPFQTVRTYPGIENRGTDIICEGEDGTFKTVRMDYHVMSKVDAPMRVRSHFVGVIGLFGDTKIGQGPILVRRLLCRESELKEALGCAGRLKTVELRVYAYQGEIERSRHSYKFSCEGEI